MVKHIVTLSHDPFAIDLEKGGGWYFVNPTSGDIQYGPAVYHADTGLSFSLTPGAKGQELRLQFSSSAFTIGWTEDANAASWVAAVNRFLETKRGRANGTATRVQQGQACS